MLQVYKNAYNIFNSFQYQTEDGERGTIFNRKKMIILCYFMLCVYFEKIIVFLNEVILKNLISRKFCYNIGVSIACFQDNQWETKTF